MKVLVESNLVRLDPSNTTSILSVKNFGGGESRVNFDSQLFGLFREPSSELREGDDIVALVGHLRRVRHGEGTGRSEPSHRIGERFLVERCAEFFPIGNQLVEGLRFNDSSREDVSTYERNEG